MRRRQAFAPFRERAFWLALSFSLLSVIALIVVFDRQPSSDPDVRAVEDGKLSPELFGVLQTVFTTTLSIGLISILFDVLLREKYGEGLRRFLNIKTAIVKGGLTDIGTAEAFPWPDLSGASDIRILARDPSPWLLPHFGSLIAAAERRAARILIALPDPQGPQLNEIAASVGLTSSELQSNIDVSVDAFKNQWAARKERLNTGASARIVAYNEIPLTELVFTDDGVSVFLSKSVQHDRGLAPVFVTFDQVESDFPTSFLAGPFAGLVANNELWAGDAL